MSLQLQAEYTESIGQDPADADQSDGDLVSRVFIELRTGAGLRLTLGRPSSEGKPAIIGLLGFADRLRGIWHAAKKGDPYARWWLLQVEAAITKAQKFIQPELTAIGKTLSACAPLGIDLSRGNQPRRIDLIFSCPYAYCGARLVKQLDTLVAQLDTSVTIGVRRKTEIQNTRRGCERAMRHVFSTSQGFWDFGVTRELIESRDPKAVGAEAKMGAVPDVILNGERWPMLLERYLNTPIGRNVRGET